MIGRIDSVCVQSDSALKIQEINTKCGRASLRKLRGPSKGGCLFSRVFHTMGFFVSSQGCEVIFIKILQPNLTVLFISENSL